MTGLRDLLAGNPFLTGERRPSPDSAVTIIVPLYNAVDDTTACLASVARHTSSPFRLLLINDGSTDPRVSTLLTGIEGAAAHLVIVSRPDNRGFVRTVNEGLSRAAPNDVVILNADTVVSDRWLAKLAAVARSRPNVATVTPLTNDGTICSVPNVRGNNVIPDGYDVDSFAALVEATSLEIFPGAPTGVGFCMFITRRALDVVGEFDVQSFGDGYGEENDFCQRAIGAGFVNLIADNTFVYHKGRASFGDRTPDLIAGHLETVAAKHPRYPADIAAFYRDHPLRPFHAYLEKSIAARRGARGGVRTRVLHVLHRGGGTEKHARDLAHMDDPSFLSYVLISDGRELNVDEYHAGRQLRSLRFPLAVELDRRGLHHDTGYRDAFATVCWTLEVDVIHVHHLMDNTLDIPDVAAERGVRYLMTLHDYYMVCPMYTLLDPDGHACGACLGGAPGASVEACMRHLGQPASYLAGYQRLTEDFLRGAAMIVAPNTTLREIVGTRFNELEERIAVIEHGHRRTARPDQSVSFDGRGPLHVAIIGGLEVHKGAGVLRDLLRANRSDSIVFHLYGTTPDADMQGPVNRVRTLDGSAFVYHGSYDAEEIVTRLRADGIHVGLQLAIWPEAFSYTLSEFVEAGIPVIAGDLGAQGERIRRCRLGWTVPEIREPASTLAILETIIQHPATLAEVVAGMRRDEALPPIEVMWRRYRDIYREVSPAARSAMEERSERSQAGFTPGYVAYLAMSLADRPAADAALRQALDAAQADLAAVRERLRSPRHRIAESVGNAIQKIPVVWPLLAWLTDAVLERQQNKTAIRPSGRP